MVKGPHTYFVLEVGVLVHNCGPGADEAGLYIDVVDEIKAVSKLNDAFDTLIPHIKISDNTLDFGKLKDSPIHRELLLQKSRQGYDASVNLDLAINAIEEGWRIQSVDELKALLGFDYDYYQSMQHIDKYRKAIHGYDAPMDHFWQQAIETSGDWWDYTKP
jgi:hypothetical protein